MAQPTEGEWRAVGTSQIYAGNKMIGFTAIKDVPDLAERVANLEVMAAGKDMLKVLEGMVRISDLWIPKLVSTEYQEEARALHQAYNEMLAAIKKARKTELQTKQ